jgi:hypothetical protein
MTALDLNRFLERHRLANGVGNLFRSFFTNGLTNGVLPLTHFPLRLANGIRNLFRSGFVHRFVFCPSPNFLFGYGNTNGIRNLLLPNFGNYSFDRISMLPGFPLRFADGIRNVLCPCFVHRFVICPSADFLFINRIANGIGNQLGFRFPDWFSDVIGYVFDFRFPDWFVCRVVNVLDSDFRNVGTIGNFVCGRNFFVDRFVTRHLLGLKDDFSAQAGHHLAMFDIIAGPGDGITGTYSAKTRISGGGHKVENENGKGGEKGGY